MRFYLNTIVLFSSLLKYMETEWTKVKTSPFLNTIEIHFFSFNFFPFPFHYVTIIC